MRRALFVKLAEQGATVLAYPALRRAVEAVGRENVYFFVFEENRFILDAMDIIPRENVIAVSTGGLLATAAGLLAGLRRIRRIGVDAAVDFEFFARSSAVICYLSGAAVRVGLHRHNNPAPYRGDLMTHRIAYDPKLHTSRAFLLMVEAMFQPAENLPGLLQRPPAVVEACPQFIPTGEELAHVRGKLEQAAGGGCAGRLQPRYRVADADMAATRAAHATAQPAGHHQGGPDRVVLPRHDRGQPARLRRHRGRDPTAPAAALGCAANA